MYPAEKMSVLLSFQVLLGTQFFEWGALAEIADTDCYAFLFCALLDFYHCLVYISVSVCYVARFPARF